MPFDVFIAYSYKDCTLRDKLETHLSMFKHQGRVKVWYESTFQPATQWETQIVEHLQQAQIILLLISADYLASYCCYSVEMQQALIRQQASTARVIPTILRPTDWQDTLFAHLQVLPPGGKFITKWPNRDEAFTAIIGGIHQVIEEFESDAPHTSSFILSNLLEACLTLCALPKGHWKTIRTNNVIERLFGEVKRHSYKMAAAFRTEDSPLLLFSVVIRSLKFNRLTISQASQAQLDPDMLPKSKFRVI